MNKDIEPVRSTIYNALVSLKPDTSVRSTRRGLVYIESPLTREIYEAGERLRRQIEDDLMGPLLGE